LHIDNFFLYIRTTVDSQTRREKALDLLDQKGELTVAELSQLTGASPMTIRRDLEVFEQEGALRRVHGGAISVASRGYLPPYSVREKRDLAAKALIGAAAASMIGERETVILDVGTTTLETARALRGRRNVTVLTSSLHIANVLAKEPGIRLMVTGGTVSPGDLSLIGDLAEDAFSRLRFDTLVMGVAGLDADVGCTEFSTDDARVKRAALATVRRCIVVADSSKLGVVTFARICPLDSVSVVVTDDRANPEQLAALESTHVEVVVTGRDNDRRRSSVSLSEA
jgi:DeoR/GlpR family transcriptional regulator of sugar metabolism